MILGQDQFLALRPPAHHWDQPRRYTEHSGFSLTEDIPAPSAAFQNL